MAELDKIVALREPIPPSSQGTQESLAGAEPSIKGSKIQEGYNDVGPRLFSGRETEFYREIEPYKMVENEALPLAVSPSLSPVMRNDDIMGDAIPSGFFLAPSQKEPPVLFPHKEAPSVGHLSIPMEQNRVVTEKVERKFFEKKESPSIAEVIFQAHLAEVDVYLRYGLNQNAVEKLLLARELDPTREEPYLRLREIYLKEGQKEKGDQIALALANLYDQKNELGKRDLLLRDISGKEVQKKNQEQVDPLIAAIRLSRSDERGKPAVDTWRPLSDQEGSALFTTSDRQPTEFVEADHLLGRSILAGVQGSGETRGDEEYIDFASFMAEDIKTLSEAPLVNSQQAAVEDRLGPDVVGVVNETKRQEYVETCYHLGLAHKETGNYEKAIRELEQALAVSGGGRFHEVLVLLATCYSESGYISQSIEVLQGGMNDPRCDGRSRLFIQYELASYFEQLGDREKSFSLYKEVYRVDPHFKDVAGKVKEIPYRKPVVDSGRGGDRFVAEEGVDAGIEDAPKQGLYLGGRLKEKRRISYI